MYNTMCTAVYLKFLQNMFLLFVLLVVVLLALFGTPLFSSFHFVIFAFAYRGEVEKSDTTRYFELNLTLFFVVVVQYLLYEYFYSYIFSGFWWVFLGFNVLFSKFYGINLTG